MVPKFRAAAVLALVVSHSLALTFPASGQEGRTGGVAAESSILGKGQAGPGVWLDGYGGGFDPGTRSLTISAGAGIGVDMFGGIEHHDLALINVGCGWMLGRARGTNHWYRGQWELRGELFGGVEFSPKDEWLVGGACQLRYNFITGSRWIPFIGGGGGVLATSISEPDLSGTFEFNLQATTGAHYFLRTDLALTVEARLLHISCAGIRSPNLGVNTVMGYVGVSWLF